MTARGDPTYRLHTEAQQHRRILRSLVSTSKVIYATINPIFFRTVTITRDGFLGCFGPSYIDDDEPYRSQQPPEDLNIAQQWVLQSGWDGIINVYDSTETIVEIMMKKGDANQREVARRIYIRQREEDQKAIRTWGPGDFGYTEVYGEFDMNRDLGHDLRDWSFISAYQHIERFIIWSMPEDCDCWNLDSFIERLPVDQRRRILPKLKSICISEDQRRYDQYMRSPLDWIGCSTKWRSECTIEETRVLVADDQERSARESLARALDWGSSGSPSDLCIHSFARDWPAIINCTRIFLETMRPFRSITLHGVIEKTIHLVDHLRNRTGLIRLMIDETMVTRGLRDDTSDLEDLMVVLDKLAELLCRPDSEKVVPSPGQDDSDAAVDPRVEPPSNLHIEVLLSPEMTRNTIYGSVGDFQDAWLKRLISSDQAVSIEYIDKLSEKLFFSDLTETMEKDFTLGRPCDACGRDLVRSRIRQGK